MAADAPSAVNAGPVQNWRPVRGWTTVPRPRPEGGPLSCRKDCRPSTKPPMMRQPYCITAVRTCTPRQPDEMNSSASRHVPMRRCRSARRAGTHRAAPFQGSAPGRWIHGRSGIARKRLPAACCRIRAHRHGLDGIDGRHGAGTPAAGAQDRLEDARDTGPHLGGGGNAGRPRYAGREAPTSTGGCPTSQPMPSVRICGHGKLSSAAPQPASPASFASPARSSPFLPMAMATAALAGQCLFSRQRMPNSTPRGFSDSRSMLREPQSPCRP